MSGPEDHAQEQPTAPAAPTGETMTIPMSKTRALNSACLFVAGAFSILFGVLDGAWLIGGFGLLLVAIGLAMYAKTEVSESSITVKRLIGGSTTDRADIAGVGLDFYKQKAKKYWYPVVQTRSGNDLDLTALASPSKENANKRALEIMTTLRLDSANRDQLAGTNFNNPNFAGTTPAAPKPPAPKQDEFEEFNLTGEYEQYLREKAEEEAAAAAQPSSATPPPPPAVTPAAVIPTAESAPAPAAPTQSPVADHDAPIEWPEAA